MLSRSALIAVIAWGAGVTAQLNPAQGCNTPIHTTKCAAMVNTRIPYDLTEKFRIFAYVFDGSCNQIGGPVEFDYTLDPPSTAVFSSLPWTVDTYVYAREFESKGYVKYADQTVKINGDCSPCTTDTSYHTEGCCWAYFDC